MGPAASSTTTSPSRRTSRRSSRRSSPPRGSLSARSFPAAPTGPDVEDTIDRVRTHLADDLDTAGALAAIDAWADDVLAHRGGTGWTADGPTRLADAADALLGVVLRT